MTDVEAPKAVARRKNSPRACCTATVFVATTTDSLRAESTSQLIVRVAGRSVMAHDVSQPFARGRSTQEADEISKPDPVHPLVHPMSADRGAAVMVKRLRHGHIHQDRNVWNLCRAKDASESLPASRPYSCRGCAPSQKRQPLRGVTSVIDLDSFFKHQGPHEPLRRPNPREKIAINP